MLGLLIVCVVVALIVTVLTGEFFIGLIVAGIVFVKVLPWAMVTSFVHGEVRYAADRADERQYLSDLDRMYAEDMRHEELMKKSSPNIYNDNRRQALYINGGK